MFDQATTADTSIVEINESNAQQILIEQSQQQLVVCHFWSSQSQESVDQNQLLTTLHAEYHQQFLLATVNCDTTMAIAQQLGVQGLPTVLIFQAGQPIDGAAGQQTEAALKELLEKYLPKPWDIQFEQASMLMSEQDFLGAIELLNAAFASSGQRSDIAKTLAHCYMERGKLDEAETILAAILLADQDPYFQQLQSQIELKREAADSPEIKALEQQLADNPEDLAIKLQLAVQYHQQQQDRKACELLINLLRADSDYANGRKTLLDIFKSLGNKDPLVVEFQRQLFSILY